MQKIKLSLTHFTNPLHMKRSRTTLLYAWASCQIRKITGAHSPGSFSPPPKVSDPDLHHGTCVTHVPWCMPGSLTSSFLWSRWRGKMFPTFPAHAQPTVSGKKPIHVFAGCVEPPNGQIYAGKYYINTDINTSMWPQQNSAHVVTDIHG